jgi:hypothetical protein
MAFWDVEWVAERTNAGDAIGFIGYNLLFGLVESALAWVFLLLLNFLLPKRWDRQIRFALLGSIIIVVSIWAFLGQLYFLTGHHTPELFSRFAISTGHPLWALYGTVITLVTASVVIPMFLFVRYPKVREKTTAVFERITLLSGIYIILDFFGIAIVIYRNLL